MRGILTNLPLGSPAALWFALAAIPVIAAFFFRLRSRVREIPALSHWVSIGRPVDARSTATWLRRLLSLFAQILLIALLVFCLTNPFPTKPATNRLAIVIDTSATMQTLEHGGNRFNLALAEARKILQRLPADTRVYLIAASNRPVLLGNKAMNPASAMALLSALHPSDTDGDLPAAIRAASFLSDDPEAKAMVISDFAGTTPPSALANLWHGPAALALIPVGTNQPDCAITACWVDPDQHGWTIAAAFTSRGMAGRRVVARVVSAGKTVAENSVAPSDLPQRLEFHADLPPESAYEIVLDTGDALAVDDRIFGVLPSRPNICLVTEGDVPLERAIRANPGAELRIVSHARYSGPGNANVLIVDGPGLRSDALGKLHGCLCIATGDPFGFASAGLMRPVSAVTHWRGDHPSLAEIDPAAIHFRLALSLAPVGTGNLMPLLSAGQTPLIEERRSNGLSSLRLIYWAFRLSDTDLASRLSFPILLWDTIDYLARQGNQTGPRATGHPLELSSATQVIAPDGHTVDIRPMAAGYIATDTCEQGIYTIRTDHRNQLVAINLLSPRGTLALPRDRAETSTSATSVFPTSPLKFNWRTLLEMALAFATIEWLLFHWRVLRIG